VTNFAEVKFKGTRRDYFHYSDLELIPGSKVIVESSRGEDLGEVTALGRAAERKCNSSSSCSTPLPQKQIIRLAIDSEAAKMIELRKDESHICTEIRKIARQHKLEMKISEAEWQFDKKKLIVYFTAESRVDFRKLAQNLASKFKARIELKQIGVRAEAAMLGGLGRCGRELCCSTWLPDLKPVSLQLAKDQNLSLNPAQISGCCGRLMCCLMYEHDTYVQARRRFPREGKTLKTGLGKEKVVAVDIWRETVTLQSRDNSNRTLFLKELENELSPNSN
jgi:cell fate regulator YaaT (PSP1 superfamily)